MKGRYPPKEKCDTIKVCYQISEVRSVKLFPLGPKISAFLNRIIFAP